MSDELIVHLGDEPVGRLRRARGGKVELAYEPEWQARPGALPLSLSMPLAARHHPAKVVEPYLWGLLPDNELILTRWARRFQVSARSAFALLGHVGQDCPGAVRILRPEQTSATDEPGGIERLEEGDIAARLRALRADASAWRSPTDSGQFSLAGAQPKTALWFDGKGWGVPHGSTPTTHILKPGVLDLEGSAHNEHLCLVIAHGLGLPVATSRIRQFEDEVAIVVTRYDRVTSHGRVTRLHQEDTCQSLAVHPADKYENDGGPGARAIVDLLREASSSPREDVDTFTGALVINWLLGGTDAHAKNYSLLIGAEGRARLAPLYDLASALPYPDLPQQKLKLAMKIGGTYRLQQVGLHQWRKLASELSLDADRLHETARSYAAALPDVATTALAQAHAEGLEHRILTTLQDALCERARHCSTLLASSQR